MSKGLSKVNYNMELPSIIKISLVVNISRVKCYIDEVDGQKKEMPQPVIVEGEEEWKVEKILNKRKMWGKNKFLVRWKGFMAVGDIWESRENAGECKRFIKGV